MQYGLITKSGAKFRWLICGDWAGWQDVVVMFFSDLLTQENLKECY